MTLPLLVKSKLFWKYRGQLVSSWYLGLSDQTSVAMQNAYIDDMDKFGADTEVINICNESISSPFDGEFMRSPWNQRKCEMLLNFILKLKQRGKNVVIIFFDFPQVTNPADIVYPFWKYKERIPDFLEVCTTALAPYVDGFMFGIESNRQPGATIGEVDAAIVHIQKFAYRMNGTQWVNLPVGTHEQNVRQNGNSFAFTRPIPPHAHFVGYETINHPLTQVPTDGMVREVTWLANNSGGRPVWVMESSAGEDAYARDQNRRLAEIPGVGGVSGPM